MDKQLAGIKDLFLIALVCQGCCNKVSQTGGLNNRNLLSHSFRVQQSKIKVLAEPCSLCRHQGRICSRPLSQFLVVCWQFLVFFGLQTHHSDLCLFVHMAFSLCMYVSVSKFLLFIRTLIILDQRAHYSSMISS